MINNSSKKYELLVIGAGLPRTGTLSTKIALEKLGFGKCYHMIENLKNGHCSTWADILENKHKDYYKIFKNYSSTVDAPSNIIWEELLKENPNAKVILTVRDPDTWYASCMETIFIHMFELEEYSLGMKILLKIFPSIRGFRRLIRVIRSTFPQELTKEKFVEYFNNYVADVRKKCPPEKLLVFNVKEGWLPLCKFLNVPVPKQEFPRVNDREEFKKRSRYFNYLGYFTGILLAGGILILAYLVKKFV